ncbi:DUF4956 domain-containing protein [Candidatus Dojkabacteria bacterium]|nr:DUF4956 domain-containing protein [Candidatus Dojkabacteria bacterium]
MDKFDLIQMYFNSQSLEGGLEQFFIDVILTVVTSLILSLVYIKFGTALSNRKAFARNFIMLSMTTMMIISVIKSSLALSLGLVGSLSIIRFRSAIKEPEELAFIFLSISLGVGFGAGQRYVTLLFFFILVLIIVIKGVINMIQNKKIRHNLYLNISSELKDKVTIQAIGGILEKYCSEIKMKRLDENEQSVDSLWLINIDRLQDLHEAKEAIRNLDPNVNISYFDDNGIFD